jgi:D-alanyl-lipoteichoic acid acyltransferase DltB (MBOAT superfamily)
MLFNTPEFIFLFLPLAVTLHFTLARSSITAAVVGTVISSLAFYAWWNPPFVLLPAVSIMANFWIARRTAAAKQPDARRWLILGIAGNLLVLCYFKYADFLLSIVDGHKTTPPNVPLALSFTTFVQIAFLYDSFKRRIPLVFSRYALFVAFFPHLIAGPIVRWGNLGGQLGDPARYRLDWENVALGLTIFTLGLAKKVLLADALSPYVATVFDAAARGEALTALAAWAGSLAFYAQIYFDFSGYSDMAVGLGLLFNYRLPINFAGPLRAQNLFDFWRRWHITLMTFLREFVFFPICDLRIGTRRYRVPQLIAAVFLTMLLAGFWHGAGWTFIAWGAYHGVMLLIHLGWRRLRGPPAGGKIGRFVSWALTFTVCVFGLAFFRAVDIETSWHLIKAMTGFGYAPLADGHFQRDDWMINHGYVSDMFVRTWFGGAWSMYATLWTALALAIALLAPDTMEIVDYREGEPQSDWRRSMGILTWRPSMVTLGVTVALFVTVFNNIGRVSEFLYFQF